MKRAKIVGMLPLGILLVGVPSFSQAPAQVSSSLISVPSSLPETPQVQGAAKISGTVSDLNTGPVSGAKVTVTTLGESGERSGTTDGQGNFSVQNLPAGRYKVTIAAAGFQTFTSQEMYLDANEAKTLPAVTMRLATANQEVEVTISKTQVAEGELKQEESQRLLGIVPNFYTSYLWEAAPLDTTQKFRLAAHSAFDPLAFVGVGIVAGIEQWKNTYPEYGRGAAGYGKRYGAAFADEATGRFLASAVFPAILHQDPRYYYKGTGSVAARAGYALSRAFVTRTDRGGNAPNYSLFLGRLGAGAIANLYHQGDRGVALTFENAGANLAGHAVDNLLREFLFKRVTPNVPDYANGQKSATGKQPATPAEPAKSQP